MRVCVSCTTAEAASLKAVKLDTVVNRKQNITQKMQPDTEVDIS